MKQNGFSDFDILESYVDILQQLCQNDQTAWNEFRSFRHFNFHCLFWDGSEEGLIN